jgi:hypothetical protein
VANASQTALIKNRHPCGDTTNREQSSLPVSSSASFAAGPVLPLVPPVLQPEQSVAVHTRCAVAQPGTCGRRVGRLPGRHPNRKHRSVTSPFY